MKVSLELQELEFRLPVHYTCNLGYCYVQQKCKCNPSCACTENVPVNW